MTTIQGKVWGKTETLFLGNNVEVNRIEARKGGFCSRHKHVAKANMFRVESGRLIIRQWKLDYDLCDETIIGPGESCVVPAGEYHQFEALEDTVALEIYWATLAPNDIVRESVGGVVGEAQAERVCDHEYTPRGLLA